MLEQFVKDGTPWEGLTLEKFVESCLSWVGPHAGAGEECVEEGVAETTCDELTTTPILCPHAPLGEEEVEKKGSKVEPGKKGGVEGRCL